jgi:hypothetical protein
LENLRISIENRYTLKCTIAIDKLRCLYIGDDNRFMFLTEIKNVGKPDVEIDVKYSERDRTVRYGLLAISALSYTENQGGATGVMTS